MEGKSVTGARISRVFKSHALLGGDPDKPIYERLCQLRSATHIIIALVWLFESLGEWGGKVLWTKGDDTTGPCTQTVVHMDLPGCAPIPREEFEKFRI